jgi:hypothetical protein
MPDLPRGTGGTDVLGRCAGGRSSVIASLLDSILRPDIVVFLIPISAIAVAGAVAIVCRMVSHRERMAMIERGIHPDHPPEEEEEDEE